MLKSANVRFLPGLTIGEDMLFVVQATKATAPKAKASDTETKASAKIIELKGYKGYGYYTNPKGAINRPFTPQYMDQIRCWELVKEEIINLTNNVKDVDVLGLKDDENIRIQLNNRLLVGIMLIVSKIAMTGTNFKDENSIYIATCHTKLQEILKETPKAYNLLDIGYKIKVTIFRLRPALYLKMYGAWKK